jgi:addiction module HigA family antidote
MPTKSPTHPGEMVREECLSPLGLTVTEIAQVLGVTGQALNNIVNERSGISPEMAIRLEKAFGTSADLWMRLQTAYDLARAGRREHQVKVVRFRAHGSAHA